MSGAALETILSSPTCRGAFRLNADGLDPLTPKPDAIEVQANATRDLWACIWAMMAHPDLMVAKRDSDLSVVTAKGGLLLETSGPVNVGFLRASIQTDEVFRPDFAESSPQAPPGLTALWSLARWVELIEARRALVVKPGSVTLNLWAEKGRFGLADDATPADLSEAIQTAAEAGEPILLEYAEWIDDAPQTMDMPPIALLASTLDSDSDWMVFNDGVPIAAPRTISLDTASDAAELAVWLGQWSSGRPFEVAVMTATAQRIVLADSETPERVRINTSALQRDPESEQFQTREGCHVA